VRKVRRQQLVGRKPKIARDTLEQVATSLELRRQLPGVTDWARRLGVRPGTLRRALREGYKHYRVAQ
jgi:hypothetical protein